MIVLSFVWIAVLATCLQAAQSPSPNVILIVLDDFGWADLQCYGSTFYRTPNLDRLATQGMRFTDAYAACPVCSPTRASILTGQYPARLQLTDWLPGRADQPSQKLLRPQIRQQLPLDLTTLAESLKKAGYSTAHIGKWHLGGKGFEPERQGFDLNIAGDHTGTPLSYFYPYRRSNATMPGLESGAEGEYLTDRLSSEAERFIEQHQKRPFFLYLAHYAVHIPLKAKQELVSKHQQRPTQPGQTQTNAIYAAMIESVDEGVGRILKKLDALKIGEQTIIFFTSDNGGLSVKEGPATPATSNAPLRAGKGHLYEGGIRVPLIAHWPGAIQPGSRCQVPVSSIDLFPTIAEIVGLTRHSQLIFDGVSLLPLLKQSGPFQRDAIYWHYPHYSNQGGKPGSAIRSGDWKLIEFLEDNRTELYNLAQDVGEKSDLAGQLPDQAAALRRKLIDWRRSVNAQMMRPNPNYQHASGIDVR
jgi:arylsulfatase A